MPRQARLVVPETALHIVQRGHDRAACFRQETDYLVYLANLHGLASKIGCAVHAYCLMTNHVHLLITPSNSRACALLMRNLGQRYVQYFNRCYRRTGTLWEGRFRSCLVDTAHYVLACYRYIELNPVRAGMVSKPIQFPWSSHAGNTGRALNTMLTPHAEYLGLSSNIGDRHAAYESLFARADEAEFLSAVRDATNGGFALIGESLKARLPLTAQSRLSRKPPGPQPQAGSGSQVVDIQAELGLRPRTG